MPGLCPTIVDYWENTECLLLGEQGVFGVHPKQDHEKFGFLWLTAPGKSATLRQIPDYAKILPVHGRLVSYAS